MRHDLKIWRQQAEAIVAGAKTAEFRRDDRADGFAAGDLLHMTVWDPEKGKPTTTEGGIAIIRVRVSHVLRGPAFGIPAGFAVLSIDTPNATLRGPHGTFRPPTLTRQQEAMAMGDFIPVENPPSNPAPQVPGTTEPEPAASKPSEKVGFATAPEPPAFEQLPNDPSGGKSARVFAARMAPGPPLPCPFCGSPAVVDGFGVHCSDRDGCGAYMPRLYFWNRRPSPAPRPVPASIARERAAVRQASSQLEAMAAAGVHFGPALPGDDDQAAAARPAPKYVPIPFRDPDRPGPIFAEVSCSLCQPGTTAACAFPARWAVVQDSSRWILFLCDRCKTNDEQHHQAEPPTPPPLSPRVPEECCPICGGNRQRPTNFAPPNLCHDGFQPTEVVEYCGQCGAEVLGHHACPGVEGE